MIVRAGRFIPYTAPSTGTRAHAGGYAAHFVEVHVDPDLGTIRVARVVSAVDGGRILNPKTARSQIIGGIAMGIGMALLEETVSDRTGRLVTTSLAEYVVPVNADVRDVDVLFVGQPDSMTPLGTKGIGELAITGMAAAIANAVYHATGTRVRSLPISIEKVLGHESSSLLTVPLSAAAPQGAGRPRHSEIPIYNEPLERRRQRPQQSQLTAGVIVGKLTSPPISHLWRPFRSARPLLLASTRKPRDCPCLDNRRARALGHEVLGRRGIILSSVATKYQLGLVFHAGLLIAPLSASTPHGTCESAMNSAFSSPTSAANDARNFVLSRAR